MYVHTTCPVSFEKGVSLVVALYANAYAGNPDDRKFWIESANDLSGEGEVIELFCNDCEEPVRGFPGNDRPTIPQVEEMLAGGEISKVEWRDR
jgi:hypothetical protein